MTTYPRLEYFNPQKELEEKIKNFGGWVNAHSHLDRAYTLSAKTMPLTKAHLHEKWTLVNEIKKNSSINNIYDRMAYAIEKMIAQGVQAVGTFIDVDELIRDKSIRASLKIRDKFKKQIKIKFINGTTYSGILEKNARKWFEVGAEFADIIGGIPAKDKDREGEHIDVLLSTAKKMNKIVHVHVDQLNTAKEKETELLADKTVEHRMQGKVVAIHSISIAAHNKEYRQKLYGKIKQANLMFVSCPTAWIDSPRSEELVPTHNSITPVDELIPNGIVVALGTDNINDIYKPYTDGNLWTELRFMLEALRFYETEELAKIASLNGLKVLGIK